MAARRKSALKRPKLSTKKAKRVAGKLKRATVASMRRTGMMKPLTRKSTATGRGTVVFRASRVLGAFGGAGKF